MAERGIPDAAETQPSWRRSLVDVVRVAVVVVVAVLAIAFATDYLPAPLRSLIVDTPLAIAVLILGTGWVLWRIGRKTSGPGR